MFFILHSFANDVTGEKKKKKKKEFLSTPNMVGPAGDFILSLGFLNVWKCFEDRNLVIIAFARQHDYDYQVSYSIIKQISDAVTRI